MRNKAFKWLTVLMAVCLALSGFSLNTFALDWDGSSTGGGGGGSPANASGYAVRTTGDNCLGYRFSVVDKRGNTRNEIVIDVFRDTYYGNLSYSSAYKFNTKYNKKQLINNQNNGFGTSKNTNNCYKEANMGFVSALPTPDGMDGWQSNHNNLNQVLSALSIGRVSDLKNGDKVLVEPLYDVRLQTIYHAVTVTEMALYGKWLLGANSNGGSSDNADSWGFISIYTNRHYPNSLYTPDGQGLWDGVGALSKRATFYNIINSGYGVGIAYTETRPDFTPNLSVKLCEAWKGGRSDRTFHFGTSNGSSFGNYSYANGYPIMGDNVWFAVHFPAEGENCYVQQSVWIDGGGSVSRKVYSNSSTCYDVSLSPTQVDAGHSYYVVKARVDWLDDNGNVQKWGAEKSFYIPIRPKINRYQVTMYDITNTQVARNGWAGQSGSVYVGQKVYPKYTYTSGNTWTSGNSFNNKINGSSDLSTSGNINKGSAFEKFSLYSPYVVPNKTSIPCVLTTSWTADPGRTSESTTINIPVIKADVELKEIRLIDGTTGSYWTGDKLWVHQKITPQYVYKNNTGVRVFVEGYDNDKSRIGGGSAVYTIPAYGEIYVNGKQITVPNAESCSFWGGVFLDGAGIHNTAWESNGGNNTKSVSFNVEHPLKIQIITPNSLYCENTEVITSFLVQNLAHFNFTPDYNIKVRFKVYDGLTMLYTMIKSSVVIPANGDNLTYFKWRVPTGLNFSPIELNGEIIDNGRVVASKMMFHGTVKKSESQTPDTKFEKAAPAGFSVISPPTRTGSGSAQWSEWVYENGSFVRKTYGLKLDIASKPVIVPDVNSPSRKYDGRKWTMASGYGFTTDWRVVLQTITGTLSPTMTAYTNSQQAFLYFPEFKYGEARGSFRVLSQIATNRYQLPTNANAKDNARLHFVPLWFPNTDYTVQSYVGDIWTPAGMLSGYINSAPITISRSAYDDHYVGRGR